MQDDWNDEEYRAARRRRYETIRSEFPRLVTRAFECEQGWYDLLHGFFTMVRTVLPEGEQSPRFELLQVKEKLGGLRIYYRLSNTGGTEVADTLLKAKLAAEDASRQICEVCGRSGVLRARAGWYATRCDSHADGSMPCRPEADA